MSANDGSSTQALGSRSQVAMRELKRLEKSNEQQPGEIAPSCQNDLGDESCLLALHTLCSILRICLHITPRKQLSE